MAVLDEARGCSHRVHRGPRLHVHPMQGNYANHDGTTVPTTNGEGTAPIYIFIKGLRSSLQEVEGVQSHHRSAGGSAGTAQDPARQVSKKCLFLSVSLWLFLSCEERLLLCSYQSDPYNAPDRPHPLKDLAAEKTPAASPAPDSPAANSGYQAGASTSGQQVTRVWCGRWPF